MTQAWPGRGGPLRPELFAGESPMRLASFVFAFVLSAFAGAAQAQVVTLNKGGFVLTYDCSIHSATRYEYTLTADTGSAARPSSFYKDPDLPAGCLGQTSTASYASIKSGYDRGHLVHVQPHGLRRDLHPPRQLHDQHRAAGVQLQPGHLGEGRERGRVLPRHRAGGRLRRRGLRRCRQRLFPGQPRDPDAGVLLEDDHHPRPEYGNRQGDQLDHPQRGQPGQPGQLPGDDCRSGGTAGRQLCGDQRTGLAEEHAAGHHLAAAGRV
uniref:DNA/RNA non-specific endonuclease domain-containing protein n=1 Tax=Panagrolaimus superbus TaxID=310955 RepID=A0A914YHJ5_9BILA